MDDLSTPPQPPTAAAPDAGDVAAAVTAEIDGTPADHHHQQQQQRPRGHVVVIGATNRPDALDPALRRAGRFDREISLGIPTEAARQQILRVLTRNLRLQGGFDFAAIARRTPGFVGADLAALTKEAAAVAVSRIFTDLDQQQHQLEQLQLQQEQDAAAADAGNQQQEQQTSVGADMAQAAAVIAGAVVPAVPSGPLNPRLGGGPLSPAELAGLAISMSDFEAALPKVQPSVRREGFTTKPDATWEDVGSLEEASWVVTFCSNSACSSSDACTCTIAIFRAPASVCSMISSSHVNIASCCVSPPPCQPTHVCHAGA